MRPFTDDTQLMPNVYGDDGENGAEVHWTDEAIELYRYRGTWAEPVSIEFDLSYEETLNLYLWLHERLGQLVEAVNRVNNPPDDH